MAISLTLFSFVKTLYFAQYVIPVKLLKYQNNYYLFGNYNYNSFLIKLNNFKVVVYSKIIYNTNISDVIIKNDTIIIFSSYPYFSIVKLTTDGNLISSITYEAYSSINYKFFSDVFGSLYLTSGNYIIKLKPNLKIDWINAYNNVDFCNGTNDFYILCRYNYSDLAILKIDLNGNILKSKAFGPYNNTFPLKIIRIKDKIYVFSQFTDISLKYYIFISKVDSSLNQVFWAKIYKTRDNINLYVSDILEIDNKFLIMGSYYNDIFYFLIDTLGNLIFSKRSNNLALEQYPYGYENSIYFYNQDSLSLFELNTVDGSSCLNDTNLIIDVFDISVKPFYNISLSYNSINPNLVNYPISSLDISVYENSYCKVDIYEKNSNNSYKKEIYDINGRFSNCNSKKIYIIKEGKKVRKVLNF